MNRKEYPLVIVIGLLLCVLLTWSGFQRISLQQEVNELKAELAEEEQEREVEVNDLTEAVVLREGEISYWGRLYDYMKQRHPETAKEAEKQINNGNDEY
jgi:hypothetical protein